ncbi:transposase [Lactiplantibacillus plantarum]|uniref:transposase n=1 Tax=Lactiplantibacillus plantarum TaxID=1590 RepID=UPI000B0AD529|nr:transposase [Lactiplantibacillus plantarum]
MPTRYDKEFKQNIINLYKQGESAAQLAREYGIGYSTVHKWIQGQAKTQSGKSPDEIKAMEKRLASLSEENEIQNMFPQRVEHLAEADYVVLHGALLRLCITSMG